MFSVVCRHCRRQSRCSLGKVHILRDDHCIGRTFFVFDFWEHSHVCHIRGKCTNKHERRTEKVLFKRQYEGTLFLRYQAADTLYVWLLMLFHPFQIMLTYLRCQTSCTNFCNLSETTAFNVAFLNVSDLTHKTGDAKSNIIYFVLLRVVRQQLIIFYSQKISYLRNSSRVFSSNIKEKRLKFIFSCSYKSMQQGLKVFWVV